MGTDTRTIRVRGGQHHQMQQAVEHGILKIGSQLILQRDPDNAYDHNAIKAFVQAKLGDPLIPIGFVSRDDTGKLAFRLDRGAVVIRCTVFSLEEHKKGGFRAVDAELELNGGWKRPHATEAQENAAQTDQLDDDIPF